MVVNSCGRRLLDLFQCSALLGSTVATCWTSDPDSEVDSVLSPAAGGFRKYFPLCLGEGGLAPEVDTSPARSVDTRSCVSLWSHFPDEGGLGSVSRALWMMGGISFFAAFFRAP